MELTLKNHRSICLVMILSSLVCMQCRTTGKRVSDSAPEPRLQIIDKPSIEGRPVVAILTPVTEHTVVLWRSLSDELSEAFNVATLTVTPKTRVDDIAEHIRDFDPVCVVLVDNRTVALYREYQKHISAEILPTVILMTSFLSEVILDIPNAVGISYEVPGVMSFVKLRAVLTRPIQKIGVIHRGLFEPFVQKQKYFAEREQFAIVHTSVGDNPNESDLQRGLSNLIDEQKVDAIWILNDNVLLTPELITGVWLKRLHRRRIPTIVGVSSLVNPDWDFGTIGILPDHEALGIQAANMIYDLADENWQMAVGTVDMPLSVQSVIDMRQVRQYMNLKPDALENVDIIKE